MMKQYLRQLNLTLWILLAFLLLISCGSGDSANSVQEDLATEDSAPVVSEEMETSNDSSVVDTVSGTIREVVDDGKKSTKVPCNAQVRSQIDSQNETIQELKDILSSETDEDIRTDILAEIKQSETDLEDLRIRYDCE